MILTTPAQLERVLRSARTVAIVGASDNPARPSYFVVRYLKTHGYTVFPVNPNYSVVDGDKCYQSIAALIQERGVPDIIDVFRRPETLVEIVEEAIAAHIKTVWFQYGVVNQRAIEIADRAGLNVVVDRCMKVEHARFTRGLSTQGFNSGVLTAKRQPL